MMRPATTHQEPTMSDDGRAKAGPSLTAAQERLRDRWEEHVRYDRSERAGRA
jgi:hypothetical protein